MEGLLPFRLDGKVAMVTGAGKGIGADIAKTLAAAGAEVWLLARTESDLRRVQSDIAALGGKSIVCPLDIKDASAVRHLISQVPVLDIMVNNAGTNILLHRIPSRSAKNAGAPRQSQHRWGSHPYHLSNGPCWLTQPNGLLHDKACD